MIFWRRHSERAIAAAAALLLQAAVYLALSERHPSIPGTRSSPTIIAMILAATRPKREVPPARRPSERRKPRLLAEHPIARPITPLKPQMHASRSTVDWQGAIQGEVRTEVSRADAPPKVRFGFPALPAEKAPPEEWDGWDEVRIQRVQRLAHGIIDLGHGCFILLWPPIPQCYSEPPNGDLFKHMHDRRNESPGALP